MTPACPPQAMAVESWSARPERGTLEVSDACPAKPSGDWGGSDELFYEYLTEINGK